MSDAFLKKIYAAPDQAAKQKIYADWAGSYDAELAQSGYATPRRCAAALHACLPRSDAAILDIGCGTGLSGVAFRLAGFTVIDGSDPSAEMLEQARSKEVYRSLAVSDPDAALPSGYDAIAAVGVIGAGAAPVSLLDRVVEALSPGGVTVFSFNDHTLSVPEFTDRLAYHLDGGAMVERFREHGDHLPAEGLGSTVYVLEKA